MCYMGYIVLHWHVTAETHACIEFESKSYMVTWLHSEQKVKIYYYYILYIYLIGIF